MYAFMYNNMIFKVTVYLQRQNCFEKIFFDSNKDFVLSFHTEKKLSETIE